MKHILITTIAAVVMLLFGGVNEVNADPLTYEVVGDTVTIKDCKEAASGETGHQNWGLGLLWMH